MNIILKDHTDLTKPKKRAKKPLARIRRASKKQAQYEHWLKHTARPAVIARDGFSCKCCIRTPLDNETFDLDHLQTKGAHPELKRDIDNLQFLCRGCHRLRTDHIKCLH